MSFIFVQAKYGGYVVADQSTQLTAYRHYTKSGHYLSVTTSTLDVQVDHYMVLTVTASTYIPSINYMVGHSSDCIPTYNVIAKSFHIICLSGKHQISNETKHMTR